MADSAENLTNLLLQDAQQEIASLRSELFNYRQVSEQRRQQCESLASEKAQLQQALEQAQHNLKAAEHQLQSFSKLQIQVKDLETRLKGAHSELSARQQQHAEIQRSFDQERAARTAAEDAAARLESERAKLQKNRDQLAAQVRLAQQKAADAEEEQLRAEDEAAGLRAELRNLQAANMGGGESASNGFAPHNHYTTHHELLQELDAERLRTATLYNTLTATKAELQRANQQLEAVQDGQYGNEQELQEAARKLRHAETELQDTQRRLQNTESELASCVAKINALQQQHREQQQLTPTVTPHSSPRTSQSHPAASTADVTPSITPGLGSVRPTSSESGLPTDLTELMNRAGEAQALTKKVKSLKSARDKLLIELDKQMIESERLGIENKALSSNMAMLQQQCTAWEGQAQAALAQVEKLKDIIEESAAWGVGGQPESNGVANGPSEDVLKQVARSTELDLQVRALCAEVGKARGGAAAVGRSLLPILQGVELKLAQLRAGGEAVAPAR